MDMERRHWSGCPAHHPARLWHEAARTLQAAGMLHTSGRFSVCELNSDPVRGISASWEESMQRRGARPHWALANLSACGDDASPLLSSYTSLKVLQSGQAAPQLRVREAGRLLERPSVWLLSRPLQMEGSGVRGAAGAADGVALQMVWPLGGR